MTMLFKAPGIVLCQALLLSSVRAQECDRCNFDGEDPSDCKDYGLIDNSELVAWHIASEDCLDTFNIKVTSTDPSLICSSANGFVSELQNGSALTTARLGLGVSEGGFFDDNGLKDQITINGETYNCEESASSCYSAMRTYFQSDPEGQQEMDDVCSTLENKVVLDRQLEQSTARNRLCQEFRSGTTIPDSCNPLWDQLQGKMDEYSDKDCPGFAFGTQNMAIPGCPDQGNNSDRSTSASSMIGIPGYGLLGSTVFAFMSLGYFN